MFDYILEVPVQQKYAKKKGIDKEVSRIVIGIEKEYRAQIPFILSSLIYALQKDNTTIHAQTIGCFMTYKEFEDVLITNKIASISSSKLKKRSDSPDSLIMECDSAEKCLKIFKNITSEAIVFYSSLAGNSNDDLADRIKRTYSHDYESAYLLELSKYELFIFYAESHESLEIFGAKNNIISTFNKALQIESTYKLTEKK